jgi:hypothetical protein
MRITVLLVAAVMVGCESSQPAPRKQDDRWGPTWASDLDEHEREREAKERAEAKAASDPGPSGGSIVIKGKPGAISSTTKTDDPDRQARIDRLQQQAQKSEHGAGGNMATTDRPVAHKGEGYPDHIVGLNVFRDGDGIAIQFQLADTRGNDLVVKGSVGVVIGFEQGFSINGQASKTVDPEPIEAEGLVNGLGRNLVGYRMKHITGVTGHGSVTLTFYPDAGGLVTASTSY